MYLVSCTQKTQVVLLEEIELLVFVQMKAIGTSFCCQVLENLQIFATRIDVFGNLCSQSDPI